MSGRGGRGRPRGQARQGSAGARDMALALAPDNPVLALFRSTAVKLNNRYDRHERLVKLSRDITIESKRIIFLLHSAITKEDTDRAVKEAKERLGKLTQTHIKSVALELKDSPNYIHARAISPGLQEFVEAKSLLDYLEHGKFPLCSDIQKDFTYVTSSGEDKTETSAETLLSPMDFLLGVADLTGELMRRNINCLASGNVDECFKSCQIVRDFYTAFLGLSAGNRELSRKICTVRASVGKVESAVYALRVRGREAPMVLLSPLLSSREAPPSPHDIPMQELDDEGYY